MKILISLLYIINSNETLDRNIKKRRKINCGVPTKLLCTYKTAHISIGINRSLLSLLQNESLVLYDTKCATLGQLAAEKRVIL